MATILRYAIAVLGLALSACTTPQRVDRRVEISVEQPFYTGAAPRIAIDAAHQNFHTAEGRYEPFARLLRLDGARVESSDAPFAAETLAGIDVLVIANAGAETPDASAFTSEEIAAVRGFVERGGALLLIADHMPYAGWAKDMAAAFGAHFDNGFAVDGDEAPDILNRENGGLVSDPLTSGIPQVRSFTGSSFVVENENARPLLRLPARFSVLFPETPWEFTDTTPEIAGEGRLQGAVMQVGEGRVALFAEAAMFTAQITTKGERAGLGATGAEHNQQFLLNVVHWLADAREP